MNADPAAEGDDYEPRFPAVPLDAFERARRECLALAKGTNGNVPVQSVYESLLRVQAEALGIDPGPPRYR